MRTKVRDQQEAKDSATNGSDSAPQEECIDDATKRLGIYLSTGEPLGFEGLDEKTKERLDNLNIWDYI